MASSSLEPKYQVFLSFRGEDTRLSFASYLLQALKDKGISVFFDEEKLEMGQELSEALLTAIAESQIAIIILSEQYASSSWCLRELSEIMERSTKTKGMLVVPIFYHIDPSDVRKQGGSFKKSFDEHQRKKPAKQVQRWKQAFAKVGQLKGFHITGGQSDRSETTYIRKIVEGLIKKLNSKSRIASEELVGIAAQKEKILMLIQQKETRVIGICGMGGIGKTTLARAVYKEVSCQFVDHSFFIPDVREKFERKGMENVVNDFLCRVLNQDTTNRISVPLSDVTINRLCSKTVFVVLDDVNDPDHIEHLGVQHLGPGSKIIVTSRDQQVLRNTEAEIHGLTLLNEGESLKLISKFAFKQDHPTAEFWDLSVKLAKCAGGLPLALKVLGSAVYQKPQIYWESLMDKLKEYPERKVFDTLKISFDGLDRLERNIFLDIACFFKGYGTEEATEILDCCYGKSARSAITNLVDRCLIEMSTDKNTLWMHDLLQEMGWEIINEESDDPRKRSRLWRLEDIHLLEDDKVTDSIKAISADMFELGRRHIVDLQLCPTSFEKMTNLRLIKFFGYPYVRGKERDVLAFKHDLVFLSDELRYLHWDFYPLKSLPSNFNPKNLVELRLRYSKIEVLWSEDKDLPNLRVLHLDGCRNLYKIPNLSRALKLEQLRCYNGWELVELPSMEHLTSLKCLHLVRCLNLQKFPAVPIHLNVLVLNECGIEEVPDSIGHLQNLRGLCLDETQIGKLPSTIKCLDKLEVLTIRETMIQNLPSSIIELHALKAIILDYCPNITIFPDFPEKIEEIRLIGSSIEEIPSSISRLKSLKKLILNSSRELKSLYELPPFIQELDAGDCMSIQTVSFADPDEYTFCEENVCHCVTFDSFKMKGDAMDNVVANALLRIYCIAEKLTVELANKSKEKELDGKNRISNREEVLSCCFLHGRQVLEPFEHQSSDSSITVELDPNKCSHSLLGFAFGILLDESEDRVAYRVLRCKWQLQTTSGDCHNFMISKSFNTRQEGQYILFDSNMVHEAMPYVEASFQFVTRMNMPFNISYDFKVKRYGVHVFYTDADRILQLSDGAECSEIFDTEDEDEDERNFSHDNRHEPEPNEMNTSSCLSMEGLQRLLQNVFSLFKGKVEQPEDASS